MGCDVRLCCSTPRETWMWQNFMRFTLGPSLQLGRWDSPGPPARAEAVLLWQEQPGSKLQEPGPLRHHKVCLTCKFANTSPPFSSISSSVCLCLIDLPFIPFYFILCNTNIWDVYFEPVCLPSLPHPGSLCLLSSFCSRFLPLLSLISLTYSRTSSSPLPSSITPLPPRAPSFLCLLNLIIHHSHMWLRVLRNRGWILLPLSFSLSHSACLLSWKPALVTRKLCVSV